MPSPMLSQIDIVGELSHSRLRSFQSCRRKEFLEYGRRVRSAHGSAATRVGDAFHRALDALAKHAGEDASQDDAITRAAIIVSEAYADIPSWADRDAWIDERDGALAIVAAYCWRWTDQQVEILASEVPFYLSMRTPDGDVPLKGHIDNIVRLPTGELAVMEHKTTSSRFWSDPAYWQALEMDHQISLYVHAARAAGYEVSSVLYDVVFRPTLRRERVDVLDDDGLKIVLDANGTRVMTAKGTPRQTASEKDGYVVSRRDETREEFSNRVMSILVDRPDDYFHRRLVTRSRAELDRFLGELETMARDLARAYAEGGHYRNPGHCRSLGGCAFLPLCSTGWNPTSLQLPEGFVFVPPTAAK